MQIPFKFHFRNNPGVLILYIQSNLVQNIFKYSYNFLTHVIVALMLLAYMLIFQMFSIMLIYDMISLHSENKLKALHLFKRIFETFFMTQYIFNFDSQEVKKENTAGFKTPCGCQMAFRKLPLLQSPSSSRKSRAALCSKFRKHQYLHNHTDQQDNRKTTFIAILSAKIPCKGI